MISQNTKIWSRVKNLLHSYAYKGVMGDFCNFSVKITHFMHISAIIVILKQKRLKSV